MAPGHRPRIGKTSGLRTCPTDRITVDRQGVRRQVEEPLRRHLPDIMVHSRGDITDIRQEDLILIPVQEDTPGSVEDPSHTSIQLKFKG